MTALALRLILGAASGAVFVWKTTSRSAKAGDRFRCRGKVKAHSDFRGEKQTELTRCGLVAISEAADATGRCQACEVASVAIELAEATGGDPRAIARLRRIIIGILTRLAA